MHIYKQVTLSTNASLVVEGNTHINNQTAQYVIKNERTCKQKSAAAQTNSRLPVQSLPVERI
jgi:hypothetical protein